MKKSMLIVFALVLAGCVTREDEARRALEDSGYSNIQVGDVAFMACGEHDKMGAKFTAANPAGHRVSGVVCCGIWKSCTVRF